MIVPNIAMSGAFFMSRCCEVGELCEIGLPDSTRKGMYRHDKKLIRKADR